MTYLVGVGTISIIDHKVEIDQFVFVFLEPLSKTIEIQIKIHAPASFLNSDTWTPLSI